MKENLDKIEELEQTLFELQGAGDMYLLGSESCPCLTTLSNNGLISDRPLWTA